MEYVKVPGWKSSIAKCTKFEDLPENAKSYVKTIEDHLNIPSKYKKEFREINLKKLISRFFFKFLFF